MNTPFWRLFCSVFLISALIIQCAGSSTPLGGPADADPDPNEGAVSYVWLTVQSYSSLAKRKLATAIWSGSQAIVWGGIQVPASRTRAAYNNGGAYNPLTGAWTSLSTTGAPDARFAHSAIWTGSEMIVWGGVAGTEKNTGGIYTLNLDAWSSTSTTNAPEARHFHTALWTGSKMFIWGGVNIDNPQGTLSTGGLYNPTGDSWTSTSRTRAPGARWGHAAVLMGSRNQIFIWGGFKQSNAFGPTWSDGYIYDIGSDSWTAVSTTSAPSGRALHSAAWTGSKVVIWGGTSGPQGNDAVNDGFLYDPGTDTWTTISSTNAPTARFFHTGVWTGKRLVIWGGLDPARNTRLNTGGQYNPTNDTWETVTTSGAPSTRHLHSAVWTDYGMFIWGGYGELDSSDGLYEKNDGAILQEQTTSN